MPFEDSDQPVQLCSLIRVFDRHSIGSQESNIPQKENSDSDQTADAQADSNFLLYAHAYLYLMLDAGYNFF